MNWRPSTSVISCSNSQVFPLPGECLCLRSDVNFKLAGRDNKCFCECRNSDRGMVIIVPISFVVGAVVVCYVLHSAAATRCMRHCASSARSAAGLIGLLSTWTSCARASSRTAGPGSAVIRIAVA